MGQNRRRRYVPESGPFPCYFNCGAELQDKTPSTTFGWEWFTGYGSRTLHFCPECRRRHLREIDQIRDAVNKRPKDYPKERVEIPTPSVAHEE